MNYNFFLFNFLILSNSEKKDLFNIYIQNGNIKKEIIPFLNIDKISNDSEKTIFYKNNAFFNELNIEVFIDDNDFIIDNVIFLNQKK